MRRSASPGRRAHRHVELVRAAGDVPAAEWAALARGAEPVWSQAFFAAMESDGLGFDGLAYLAFREDHRLTALLPVFWQRAFSPPPPPGAGALRRRAPAFGILFCGHPMAAGRLLGRSPTLHGDVLLDAVGQLARDLGLRWFVFKDFAEPPVAAGTSRRLAAVRGLPDAVLDLPASFEEYVRGLRPKARRNTRRKLRDLEAAGVSFEVDDDFGSLVPAMVLLYEQVLARAPVRFDALGPAFFEAIARADMDRRVVTCRHGGRLIGFVVCAFSEHTCVALRTGLDYDFARRFGVWFGLHYRVIELACAHGCRRVNLLQSTYSAKRELGARLEPLSLHVGHTSRAVQALARLAVPRVLERELAGPHPALTR